MLQRDQRGSFRSFLLIVVGIFLGATLITPAVAHVGGSISHLWGAPGHIKAKVKTYGDGRWLGKTAKAADSQHADEADHATTADSADSATTAGSASFADDSDLLDGMDSTAFAPAAAEALRHVGTGGEPAFNDNGFCAWSNYDGGHAQASFYKDPWGSVHLQGLVKGSSGCEPASFPEDAPIFTLPEGYRPARRSVFMVITNSAVGRINIDPNGIVSVDPSVANTGPNLRAWLSLQGLSFRAEAPLPAIAGVKQSPAPPRPER